MTVLPIMLAIAATLTPMRPKPTLPTSWEAELTEEEAAAFDEGNEWVSEIYDRRRLWHEFLKKIRCVESPQSTAGVRFTLTYKHRVWAFDEFGHFWNDSRFIREDEQEGLEVLESWFRELVERSPYAGFEWGVEEGETVNFRGFEDGRFNALDFTIMRLCEDFNLEPKRFWELSGRPVPKQVASVHELHPRMLKALLLEECYWTYPANLDDQIITEVMMELAESGFDEGGRFEGWFNAVRDFGSRHSWRGENDYYLAQYAERVVKRFNNPGTYVPVITRKAKDE